MELMLDVSLYGSTLRMIAPILLAALGGAICARVGIFNVGLEGLMLTGAFAAITGNHLFGDVWLAVLFAVICSGLMSLILAWLTIGLNANMIVVGVALNFLATGLTTYCLFAIFNVKGSYYDPGMAGLPKWDIPLVGDIPGVGGILSGHSPLVYFAFLLAFALQFFLFRTVKGFRLLAAGEHPEAARSLGIRIDRIRYFAVLASGVLCGLAGAQLSLGQVTQFTEGMTAGRGFIALVAVMLGQNHPLGVALASLLFGFMDALSIRLQGYALPTQFTMALPYVMTLAAMFFFKDRAYLRQTGRID